MTILFADLVGSTAQAERRDPEDVRATLSAYYARLRTELERHGGTVEKFIGDAVMAVFGAPVAHEDDPERAVRAALAIRDVARRDGRWTCASPSTRARRSSRAARSVAAGEAMVAGDVVNTAARLQTAAPVNGVLVGETTYRATAHAIEYRRRRRRSRRRGSREPCRRGRRSRPRRASASTSSTSRSPSSSGARTRSRSSPSALARVRREREPQLVTLVGVPGHRQEPARRRAAHAGRRAARADHLAAGPLPAVRRGRELLGARRDGEGAGRHPRDRLRAGGRDEARRGGCDPRHRRRRGRVGARPHAAARRAEHRGGRRRSP